MDIELQGDGGDAQSRHEVDVGTELQGDGGDAQSSDAADTGIEPQGDGGLLPAGDLHGVLKHKLGAPPRRVSAGAQWFVVFGDPLQLFLWVWLSICVLFLHCFFLSNLRVGTSWHLMTSPTWIVPAHIINMESTRFLEGDRPVYMFEYNYTTATGEAGIGKSYQLIEMGWHIEAEPMAEYSLRAPQYSVLKGMRVQTFDWAGLASFIIFFPSLGVAGLACWLPMKMLWLDVLKQGVETSATLVDKKIDETDKHPTYKLTYEFRTSETQTHTFVATEDQAKPEAAEDVPKEIEIILYNPSRPEFAVRLKDLPDEFKHLEVAEDGSIQCVCWQTARGLSFGPGLLIASSILGPALCGTPSWS